MTLEDTERLADLLIKAKAIAELRKRSGSIVDKVLTPALVVLSVEINARLGTSMWQD